VAPRARQLAPGADGGDLAADEYDDPVGLGESGRLRGGPDDRRAPLTEGCPQLDLGGGVQGTGDVVGQEELGVGSQRSGEREALDLASGEPDTAVPHKSVLAAGLVDVA
jgi:hypothetical protein